MTELPWWLSLSNALLCLLWSVLAVLSVRLLVQRGHALWLRARDGFGPAGTRTLSMVCGAALFIGSMPRLVEAVLRLVYGTIVGLPLRVMEEVPGPITGASPQFFQALGRTLRLLVSGMASEVETFQHLFPSLEVAFFLLLWFVVGQAMKIFFPPDGEPQSKEAQAIAKVLRGIGVSRGMLLFLLVFGLALCTASITAISELHDTVDPANAAPSSEELERRLKASQDGFINEAYPYSTTENDSVALLQAELLQAQQGPSQSREHQAALAQLSAQLTFVVGARPQLRNGWDNLLKLSQGRYERATQDAITSYVTSGGARHGTREQRQLFLDIVEWHQRARFELRSAIERCKQAVVATETAWTLWATDTRYQMAGVPALSSSTTTQGQLRQVLLDAQGACQAVPLKPEPRRADFGDALGPLKPIAGWLLQTESVQLALIIGMLGAGLLGSGVATFLRSQRSGKQSEGQLAGVVVRGVTAAIVVFLAVQGGLSTVAVSSGSTPPSPNPYLLLLICFVAAVYSEQVWNTALRRLVKQLGSDDESQSPPEPAALAPTPTPNS